jgi:hypothetical protein
VQASAPGHGRHRSLNLGLPRGGGTHSPICIPRIFETPGDWFSHGASPPPECPIQWHIVPSSQTELNWYSLKMVHSMLLQNKLTSFTPWANLSLLSLRCFEISCQRFSQFQTRCCSKTPTSTPCWQVCGISPWMPESFFPSLVLLLFSLS